MENNSNITTVSLKDTANLMNSSNYKKRFLAEYWQTKIRYNKLHNMLVKYDAGKLDFTPTCPIEVLREQKQYMGMYLNKLEIRAVIEDINLNDIAELVEVNQTVEDTNEGDTGNPFTDFSDDSEDIVFFDTIKDFINKLTIGTTVYKYPFGQGKITDVNYIITDKHETIVSIRILWTNGATSWIDSEDDFYFMKNLLNSANKK